jgi:hypothetical protein
MSYNVQFFKTINRHLLLISLGSLCIFAKMWRSRSCTSIRYFRCFEFEHVHVGPRIWNLDSSTNVLSFLIFARIWREFFIRLGIIKIFPARESLVMTSRLGTGKSLTFFTLNAHFLPSVTYLLLESKCCSLNCKEM